MFTSGCATQREKTEAALRDGNFSVLFPPVSLEEFPLSPPSAREIWLSDSQAKRKVQFGTLESRYETFKALFSVYFPAQYLTNARDRVRSLSQLMMEKMWRDVREEKEWSTFLTLLSNLKLFQAKMARPLVFEYLKRGKDHNEVDDDKIWEDLERQLAHYFKGVYTRKTLPALFNMDVIARKQFLDILQTSQISFISQMCLKARGQINRTIYEEHFGPLQSNRTDNLDKDFFLENEVEDPNQTYDQSLDESAVQKQEISRDDQSSLQRSQKLRSKCHLTYNPKTNTLDGLIDIAIVGAGSTGSYMAFLLWRAGYKVLLIDKGPLLTRFSPMGKRYALWNFNFLNSKNFFEEGKLLVIRPELVGGGDTIGPQVAWPMTDSEMIHFIQSKREAGPFPSLFYDEEKLSELQTTISASSGIRVVADEELSSREKLFRETALSLNLDVRALRSGFGDGGMARSSYNKTNLPLDSYLRMALGDYKNPLCFLPRVEVQKVIVQRIGTKYVTKGPVMKVLPWPRETDYEIYPPLRLKLPDNLVFKILPKFVILSAGVPGTLQIMQNSGITHPELGKSIAFNFAQILLGLYPRDLQPMTAPFTRVALGPPRSDDMDPYEYMIHEIPFEGPHLAQITGPYVEWAYPLFRHADHVRTLLVALMNEAVGGNGYNSKGGFIYNNLETSFNKLKQGLLTAAKMHFDFGARAVMLPRLFHHDEIGSGSGNEHAVPAKFHFDSLENFEAFLTELKLQPYVTPMLIFAPNGGAVRGRESDSHMAPVDQLGRPQGFENLYVMDATVLPPGIGPYHSFFLKGLAHTMIQVITGNQKP
ncbi:MAG: hypothetical protein HYV97_07005 [Bdellovibrio sp.]|nr:hypothetical protein [Bdellovibrio sp.]